MKKIFLIFTIAGSFFLYSCENKNRGSENGTTTSEHSTHPDNSGMNDRPVSGEHNTTAGGAATTGTMDTTNTTTTSGTTAGTTAGSTGTSAGHTTSVSSTTGSTAGTTGTTAGTTTR